MSARSSLFTAAAAVALSASPVLAQEAVVEELVVRALPLGHAVSEAATPVISLSGDDLVLRRGATLGETLNGLPGVQSDTFGAGASRPVIRGQTSPRVKVLSDSSEIMDASAVSPDHAVSIEPMLLEGVEVLRGPSALLFGGGAVGGAVNLIDGKIPTAAPEGGAKGVAEVRLGKGADERAGVLGVTAGAGPLALHFEGVKRRSGDYRVPDWPDGRLDGSYNRATTGSLGASLVGERGYFGLAYTDLKSEYGLPGHEHGHEYEDCHPHGSALHCAGHDHDHDHEDDDHDHGAGGAADIPFVNLKSRRVDLRGELRDPLPGLSRLRVRGGSTDYRHQEIEDGAVGTTFKNRGHDGRIEAEHRLVAGWRGVAGAQHSVSDFSALGTEAFLPKTRTRTSALFLFEELKTGPLHIELAARQDWQTVEATGPRVVRDTIRHRPFSVSGAAIWDFAPGYSIALAVSRSQRAPNQQELHARGVHLATNTYELGTDSLKTETSNTLDLTLRRTAGATAFTLGAYQNRIEDYIYARTLDRHEDFRLIRYSQADARFTGLDGEISHVFSPVFTAAAFGDVVRARLTGAGGSLPRIPAARLGLRGDFAFGDLKVRGEYQRVFEQRRVAAFETATPGYDMLNATVSYDFQVNAAGMQAYLRATNLLDEPAFNHASFIAKVAPLPGRTVVAGLRARF